MEDKSPLLVPMAVEALVVNDHTRAPRDQIVTFMRTQMGYRWLRSGGNVQASPDGNDTNFAGDGDVPPDSVPASEFYNGVYLKWRLPRAFTSGLQDQSSNAVVYPCAPNRWLIVRYSGDLTARQAQAWIVQSDFLYDPSTPPRPANISQQAAAYTQPDSQTGMVYIGRNFSLATGTWTEPNTSLNLTAMGPGNPAFAFYQPQCNNVFSFVDCLNDTPPGTLSYQVLGWFSAAADDPLAPGPASVELNPAVPAAVTVAFTASSPIQVDWSAGSVTLPSGVSYAIAAGNSGAMETTTYLYVDPVLSVVRLQVSTDVRATQFPGCILLATAAPFFLTKMAELGWTLTPDPNAGPNASLSATWTLLSGSVDGVAWQTAQLPPGGAPGPTPDSVPVSIAVGNTSAEALTAMISAQALIAGEEIESELLDAFQLNALDVLDQPDGSAVLAEKLRASFFQRYSGGYVWHIVDAPDANVTISAQEAAAEAVWLAALNAQQQLLNQAVVDLGGLQRQLYVMWWKYTSWISAQGFDPPSGCLAPNSQGNEPANLGDQLNPDQPGSLAWQVVQTMDLCAGYTASVPHGATPDALAAAITAYELAHALPKERRLKRGSAPSFYLTNNPVVLIAGAGASGIVQSPATVPCRFSPDIVTGFNLNGADVTAATPGLTIPQPALSGLSGVPWTTALLTALLGEFFFTDPNNAASIAPLVDASVSDVQAAMAASANALGTYPTGAIAQWTENPWHPLLLFWNVTYYPIAYGTPQAPNWEFEGTHYTWNTDLTAVQPSMTLNGLIQLAPTAAFNMKSRIDQFLANNPNLNPQEREAFDKLLRFVKDEDHWDLLSQGLDGFNQQLQLGTPGVFLGPAGSSLITQPPLATLIGDAAQYPPNLGTLPTSDDPPTTQFQPWRAGQFEFLNLFLVDEWGQALEPFTPSSYTKEIVYTPPELTPILTSNSVPATVGTQPMLASVAPLLTAPETGLELTVSGVNFTSACAVQWQGVPLPTTFAGPTQLTATVPAASVTAGTAQVSVVSGGLATPSVPVAVSAGPAIAALSPRMMVAGTAPSDTFAVIVTGMGFAAGALVQWNGVPVDTTVADAATLTAQVPSQFLFAPGTASITVLDGAATSNALPFTIAAGAMIDSIVPNVFSQNSPAATLAVTGAGFEPRSTMLWNNVTLSTTYVSPTQLTASVPASLLTSAGGVPVVESVGAKVLRDAPDPFIQLPPALLQPARLDFSLISATDSATQADPIGGWVLPNHLDSSLIAYDASGVALGEMSVGVSISGNPQVFWTPAPNSPYATLQAVAAAIPHFGAFLLALSLQPPATFADVLAAVDETLWTTVPMGAVFDQSLAALIGRPLAFVRARLVLVLDGPATPDPSWQFTFNPTDCTQILPQTPAVTGYQFGIELGNVAQIDDGLIGYFKQDDYTTFNIVQQANTVQDGYLNPIGANGNYLFLPPDGKSSVLVSMLVDPRAGVHANTAILPTVTVTLPPAYVADALAAMQITFRVDGVLTDTQPGAGTAPNTVLVATPRVAHGAWTWVEDEAAGWKPYATAANGTEARLAETPPTLRRGYLQLVAALDSEKQDG